MSFCMFLSEVYMIYSVLFLVLWGSLVQAEVVKETVIRYTQEVINGESFAHRSDITNGIVKEQWSVNNKVVSREFYDQSKDEAVKQELEHIRKKEEERR